MFILWITREKLWISSHSSLRVTRNIHLWYYFYKAVASVFHDFTSIFLCIVAAVALSVGFGITPSQHFTLSPCSYFGEFGVFFDFDAPALIFGQVPMEAVHLIGCHHVKDAFHFFLAEEVTTFIKHETTPAKAGSIFNIHHRNTPTLYRIRS